MDLLDGFRKKAMFNNLSLPCRPWKLCFLIYSLISRSLLWLWNLCFYVFLKKKGRQNVDKTVNAWNLQQKTQIGLIEVLNNRYLVLFDNKLNEAVDHICRGYEKYCNNKRASRPMNWSHMNQLKWKRYL